jgi:N6-adenosine-specific RNA methylase IME4
LSNTNNKIEKSWAKSVLALKSHHDALVEEKIIDPERMRLIFADREERKKAVVQLGIKGLSQRQIAAVIGVGLGTVNRDLDVPNGTESVPNGTSIIEVFTADILAAASDIRSAKTEARRAERVERIAEISNGNAALNLAARYPVIYADPPWRYDHNTAPPSRKIENQYPTMSLDDIKVLPVADIALDDCVLFMWATSPKLAEAMEVLEAWEFNYRTLAVWDKKKIGLGYFFRQQHELLLVAIRGNPPRPPPANRVPSLFAFPRGKHSEKPAEVYEIIERMYPKLPKIELFARARRAGWEARGNQSAATKGNEQ